MGDLHDMKGMTTQGEDAAPACPSPSERAGVKTSEFWLALAMMLVGAWLISKGKDEVGGVLCMAAGTVYTGFRGLVKSRLAAAGAILLAAALLAACTPGYLKASEIQEITHAVCDRHDDLVRAKKYTDAEGGARRQQSDLRSSAILAGTVDEAVAAGEGRKAPPKCPEGGGPSAPHCGCRADRARCENGKPDGCSACCTVLPCPQESCGHHAREKE